MEKKFKEQQGQQYSDSTDGEIGETVIDRKPSQTKESNKSVGEYVDYEDIKD